MFHHVLNLTSPDSPLLHFLASLIGGAFCVAAVRVLDRAALAPLPRPAGAPGGTSLEETLHKLGDLERRVFSYVLQRRPVAVDANAELERQATFGQRVADHVASFGGSWTFIGLFLLMMAVWMAVNARGPKPFDPFPFILLNLMLSCVAALQAPVIMMSQNRQAARDRIEAHNDYQVNLNAELQVNALHAKFDELRQREWDGLMDMQRRQLELLDAMLAVDAAARHAPAERRPSAEPGDTAAE